MSDRHRLHQVLGTAFGVAVLVGNSIGVGILKTPGEVARLVPSTTIYLVVWLVGGLYALLGAMTLSEPGAMIQRSGGQYPIVHRALGPFPGFMVGWSDWLSTSASIALVAMGFAEYLAPLIPALGNSQALVAGALVLAFGLMQWKGVKRGEVAQQILTAFKALALAILAVTAVLLAVPDQGVAPAVSLPAGMALLAAFALALPNVIFTHDGWTGPIYFGEETVDAGRSIPRAMISGVLVVLVIYLLLNIAMLRVLGVDRMAGDAFPAATVAGLLFGAKGDLILRLIILGSFLGAINANVMMAPRVVIAMSEDRLMPPAFTTVNAGGTPTVSHWATIGVTIAFIVSGTFNAVLTLAAFFFVFNYTLSFASTFVLRRTEPDTPRPFRVPAFTFTVGIALLGSIGFIVSALLSDTSNALKSIALLALSYPVYWMVRRVGKAA